MVAFPWRLEAVHMTVGGCAHAAETKKLVEDAQSFIFSFIQSQDIVISIIACWFHHLDFNIFLHELASRMNRQSSFIHNRWSVPPVNMTTPHVPSILMAPFQFPQFHLLMALANENKWFCSWIICVTGKMAKNEKNDDFCLIFHASSTRLSRVLKCESWWKW